MTIDAAQLMVKINADSSAAQAGIAGFANMLGPGGVLGLGVAAGVAAVAGIGVASVKMAGDFQEGMTSLVTGAGESQANLAAVSAGILKMAVDTGTSTQQLTAGMYMIESAGFHGASGLKILQAAAEGAKVGNADLGVVADATTTILKDYPGVLNGASGAVNTLIATVANGKTHMQDLATSLSQVLPTAAASKIGLNDVMGAMATMTGEGVPAANAATYLRQTIIALDAPAKGAQKALAAVGLSSSQVATEMQKSLPGALQMITDAVGKKFPQGSAGYMQAMKAIAGGSKQMQGMLDLTGGHLKDFQANVGNVSGAVQKGGKNIVGWSEVQKDFNFKMGQAGQVVQTLMIQLGTKLLPVLSTLVTFFAEHLPGAVSAVTGAFGRVVNIGQGVIKFFQDTGPAATAVKVILATLAGAMLGFAASAIPSMITGLVASVTAWGAEAVAAGAAAIATIAAAAPFILIGAAIGIVIAIIILAVTHWKQITTALGHFKDMLGNVLGAIGGFIGNVLGAIGKFVGSAIAWFQHLELMVITAVVGFVESIPVRIHDFVMNVLGAIGSFVGNAINWFQHLELMVISAVVSFVQSIPQRVQQMAQNVLTFISNMVTNAINFVTNLKNRMVTGAQNIVSNFVSALAGLPGKMLSLGEQIIQGLANGIRNAAGSVKSALSNIPLVGGAISNLIPHFASGGTMPASGVALVGEQGPEMVRLPAGAQVVPLSSVSKGGLAPLPGGFGGVSGTPQTIYVTVQTQLVADGRQLAQVVVPNIPAVVRNATGTRSF